MNKKLFLIFSSAIILRLSLFFIGYHGDLNNNISWGLTGFTRGLDGFYEYETWSYSVPNQPPLYILLFVFLQAIWELVYACASWLNDSISLFPSAFIWFWQNRGMILLVKTPSLLADLVIGLLIFRFLKNKKPKWALRGLLLWLFNPVVWYNSAVWGQTDVFVNLLGFVGILNLLDRKLVSSVIWFTLSFLFKGSLAIFAPIIIYVILKQKYEIKTLLKASIFFLLIIALVSIWFHPKLDLYLWLFNLYKNQILPGEIGFLTANAFNFWWLVNPGRVYDSKIFFGLSVRVWGYFISLGLILPLILKLKKIKPKKIFFALGLSALVTFLFMSRIHERYLYPFFPMATVSLAYYPQILPVYLILSLTHLLNLYHLFWVPNFSLLENLYTNYNFMNLLSTIQIIGFFYLYYIYFAKSK